MFCLVPKHLHSCKCSCKSTNRSQSHKHVFADPPFMFLCLVLVYSVYKECYNVNKYKIKPKIFHLYASSVSIVSIHSSSNCFASTGPGACVIRHEASLTLGNAITSRILSSPNICITSLSRPYASPA